MATKKTPKTYKVQKNDTYRSIAKQFGLTPKEVIAFNGLKFPFKLKTGQVVKLTGTIAKPAPKKSVKKVVAKKKATKKAIAAKAVEKKVAIKKKATKKVAKKKITKIVTPVAKKAVVVSKKKKHTCNWFLKSIIFIVVLIVVLVLLRVFFIDAPFKFGPMHKSQITESENPSWYSNGSIDDEEVEDREVDMDDEDIIGSAEELEEFLEAESETEVVVEPIPLVLLNGSGVQGQAKRIKAKIVDENFTVTQMDNADRFDYAETIIEYPIENLSDAIIVRDYFETIGLKSKLKESYDVKGLTVIIGKDNS